MVPISPSRPKVAAVVVLYNPDGLVCDNIRSYLDQVDVVYAVDNSDYEAVHLAPLIAEKKVHYIPNGSNLGIAKALNIGAERAIQEEYDYLLTMDQDSSATADMVDALLGCLEPGEVSQVGIVSPFHLTDIDTPPVDKPYREEVLTAWTSGNLLNLNIYRVVGPYRDDFFIDFVDHEYCLRLQTHGYRVVQSNRAVLHHCIGTKLKKNKFLYLTLITSNHSCTRRYYITRNRFLVQKQYGKLFPGFLKTDRKRFFAELVNILFFERNRFRKYLMICRGYWDYLIGKMGRLTE
ncbi:glycosyltransferase family 2 protein [Geobacter sp. FeAm09]|uniref:glycosyltransferase family 2 protein n=1 Tax=Geobacter sp. FeAm09 TaxID=2597769 RepID=UPI0011EEF483|nr:glycosyltransferase family 2 protein [Geobacter sp. FeAm09]QEM68159.1 glycosyltransferase family 2 protein [Geobacter sp. FeAm09]